MATTTTMKISTSTRDRLRALGNDGDTLEDVVIEALDAYESQRFWVTAERAVASETPEQRAARKLIESDVDTWMDGIG